MFQKIIALLLLATPGLACASNRFWVWDLTVMPPAFRQPTFSHYRGDVLKNNKDRVEIWVEDNLGAHTPDEMALDKLLDILARHVYEEAVDPGTSLLDLQKRVFGEQPTPPSGDRSFHVLITALPPYEKNGKKFGFDGFFNVFDQLTEDEAMKKEKQHSNERNIIYVNALQDINSPYMRGVVAHEFAHLLTHGKYDEEKNALEPWPNELIGEAAMQLVGYFTDQKHVEKYLEHPEWPLAVRGYGISYGGLSLFAEYLMKNFDPKLIGSIAPAHGDGFKRLEQVYGKSWPQLFAGYAKWLYEQSPPSSFENVLVKAQNPGTSFHIAPTGLRYLPVDFDTKKLTISALPKGCARSKNVLRTSLVQRSKSAAQVLWVESNPPCAASVGEQKFQQDAFEVR